MKSCMIMILSAVLLTGCWDHQEMSDMLYVTALGVDFDEGEYTVYAQFMNFATIAHSESPPNVEHTYSVGKGKGKSVNMAFGKLYNTSQRKMNWTHMGAVILTERTLNETKGIYLDGLERYREFRMTPGIFGTKEDIEKIFNTKPFFSTAPLLTLLHQPKDNFKQQSFIEPMTISDYVVKLNEPGNDVHLPSLSIDKNTWGKDGKMDTKLMYDGFFAIEKLSKVTFIPRAKSDGLRWVNPATRRVLFELPSCVLVVEKPPKIKISYQEDTQKFHIKVRVKAILVGIQQENVTESQVRNEAAKEIESQIRETFAEGVKKDMDVYSLNHERYKLKKPEVALTKDSLDVEVSVKMIHSGHKSFDFPLK